MKRVGDGLEKFLKEENDPIVNGEKKINVDDDIVYPEQLTNIRVEDDKFIIDDLYVMQKKFKYDNGESEEEMMFYDIKNISEIIDKTKNAVNETIYEDDKIEIVYHSPDVSVVHLIPNYKFMKNDKLEYRMVNGIYEIIYKKGYEKSLYCIKNYRTGETWVPYNQNVSVIQFRNKKEGKFMFMCAETFHNAINAHNLNIYKLAHIKNPFMDEITPDNYAMYFIDSDDDYILFDYNAGYFIGSYLSKGKIIRKENTIKTPSGEVVTKVFEYLAFPNKRDAIEKLEKAMSNNERLKDMKGIYLVGDDGNEYYVINDIKILRTLKTHFGTFVNKTLGNCYDMPHEFFVGLLEAMTDFSGIFLKKENKARNRYSIVLSISSVSDILLEDIAKVLLSRYSINPIIVRKKFKDHNLYFLVIRLNNRLVEELKINLPDYFNQYLEQDRDFKFETIYKTMCTVKHTMINEIKTDKEVRYYVPSILNVSFRKNEEKIYPVLANGIIIDPSSCVLF